jgi:DNA-binding NarL/FixJ family response regulator
MLYCALDRWRTQRIAKRVVMARLVEVNPSAVTSLIDCGAGRSGRNVRVILVDCCPATRLGVSVSLQETKGVEVVSEATNAEEALHLIDELRPDLVILDIELGEELEGLWLCNRLKASSDNRPQVLVYTARNSREDIAGVSLVGADGYLHKSVDCARIREAVTRMHGGERIWFLGPAEEESHTKLRAMIEQADLTPKEGEVLSLLLRRHTNAEIAEQLSLSCNTVKTHVSSILRKMALRSRQDILKAASS